MATEITQLREFGKFCLDTGRKVLWREGQPVPMPLKELELLCVLVERRGELVTKDELLETVWPDAFVEESNLSRHIYLLRKTLKEFGESEELIQNVPRRGYRFAAPVRECPAESHELIYTRHTRSQILIEESHETDAQPVTVAPASVLDVTPETAPARVAAASNAHSDRQLRKLTRGPFVLTVIAVVAVLTTGAGIVRRGWQHEDASASDRREVMAVNGAGGVLVRSLAVLPFRSVAVGDYGARNMSAAGELTDAVTARLGASGSVNLTPKGAALAAKMTPNNLLLAGRALQMDAVLSGALFRSDPEEVYLRLHLVSVGGGEVLWAETFKQPRNDLPSLLDAIARGVEEGLQRLASAEEYERRASRHTANRDAYQLYLQGRFIWEGRHDVFAPDPLSLNEPAISLNQLEQSLALDPNFALAHVGLADHYKTSGHSSDNRRRAEDHALKAVALDPTLAEPHATLGFIRMFHDWDWAGAESHFRRALELDPGCVTAHQWYALFHSLRGNESEALKEIVRARELAPYSFSLILDAAEMQYHARRGMYYNFSYAADSLHHARTLHPNSDGVRELLVRTYWMNGIHEAAAALRGWQGSPQDFARHNAGPRQGSRDFDDITPADAYFHARWHAQLNQREEALDLLERAYRDHHFFIIYLKADPFFDPLRDEPRFRDLLKNVGLE